MDNSVYQPLSHALNPPTTATRPTYSHAVQLQNSVEHDGDQDAHADISVRHEEEEEEEEEEVEGAVVAAVGSEKQSSSNQGHVESVPARRRPGRPKGSKNKKPRFDVTAGSAQKQQFSSTPLYTYPQQPQAQQQQQQPPQAPTPQPSAVPAQQHTTPQPVPLPYPAPDPSNQALYDFQWRVLSLCSEFYNAADELIRTAPQHILHQCFSLPGNQVDPITLLHEARKACDQLMANPASVVLKVPPQPASVQYTPTTPAKAGSPPAGPVITNPGSFVVSLSGSPAQTPQQGAYSAGPTFNQSQNRYPTTPYYAYATQPNTSGAHPYMAQQQVMKPVNLSTPSAAGNQGAWSDEETERLKQLAEESKTVGGGSENGEYDWDWVCNNWGSGRTRHQILIKATNMNLKESSSRATKRRRDTEPGHGAADGASNVAISHSPAMNGVASSSVANTSTQAVLNAVAAAASSGASPASTERPTSSSVSPVTVHPQQPAPPPAPPGGGSLMHWPMPHVAANTPSPVISSGSLGSRSVYYNRERNGSKA